MTALRWVTAQDQALASSHAAASLQCHETISWGEQTKASGYCGPRFCHAARSSTCVSGTRSPLRSTCIPLSNWARTIRSLASPSRGATGAHVAASHTRAVPSLLTVTRRRPSGLNAAWTTPASCDNGGETGRPVATSHTRAVRSKLAVTTRRPSGLNAACLTSETCLNGGETGWPVATSHTRAVRSKLAVTTRRPSGLNAACLTSATCRNGGETGRPVIASHARAAPLPTVMRRRPSGLNASVARIGPRAPTAERQAGRWPRPTPAPPRCRRWRGGGRRG